MNIAGGQPLVLRMEGFDKNMNQGKRGVHVFDGMMAVSRRATGFELTSDAPIPCTMSSQPVARVTSQTEIVSRA